MRVDANDTHARNRRGSRETEKRKHNLVVQLQRCHYEEARTSIGRRNFMDDGPQPQSPAKDSPGDALAGAIAAASRLRLPSRRASSTVRGSWSDAIAQAGAASRSPYRAILSQIENDSLRAQGFKLVASQEAVAKARADASITDREVIEELDNNFKFRPEERLLARAPLNRAMRASARITDASHALDNDVNAFMTNLVQLMQSVEKRRAVDVSRAEEQLRASVAARKSETEALEARSQSERLGRLKGALRLARSWKGAQLTGQREADALIALLRSELSHMEAAWDADKLRRDAESEAQGEASRNAIAKLQEEARLAEEALRQEHMEAIAQAEVEHEEVLSKLSEELERERGLREGLEASLAKALADAEREITRLQTEVSGYRNYSSTANYALQANTRKLREEKEELQKEADAKLRREREAALFRQKSLEEEVKRLRSVQEDVLVQGGALPGGEVRQYLFLEATKTRKLLQPAGSISWRGQRESAPPGARTQRAREPSRGSYTGIKSPRRPESARQARAPPFGIGY